MWSGCLTALITPFREGGAVDYEALGRVVEAQIAGGVQGLVPAGSTGEAATLTHEEHAQVVRAVVEMARKRVPVIAGTGSNATAEAIRLTQEAERAGADGALLISPYYNRPPQEGIFRHYQAVAAATRLPLLVYNIPSRTASNILPDTMVRLAAIPNVVGVKDATGNVLHCQELLRRAGDRVVVTSGDDPLTLPLMSVGAQGVISVTSNLYPQEVCASVNDALAGRWDEALIKHRRLLPVHRALFLEPNPQPLKAALALKKRMHPSVRLPMLEASEATRQLLADVMRTFEAP